MFAFFVLHLFKRSKRQQRVRAQLQEWKRSEEISKEAAKDLNADCARPKVHDAGRILFSSSVLFVVFCSLSLTSLLFNAAAILRQLQNRDLDAAKARQKKVDEINQSKLQREAKIKEATAALLSTPYVERDPNRLIAPTKAYERGVLKAEDLDVAERRRSSAGAHGARVPLQGRDLHNIGRATPSWCKAMK